MVVMYIVCVSCVMVSVHGVTVSGTIVGYNSLSYGCEWVYVIIVYCVEYTAWFILS